MAINEPGVVFMQITREEADTTLAGAAAGSYLIRPSSQGPTVFSLSYKHAQTGRLGHLLLKRSPQGTWATEGIANGFASLRSLLKRLPYGLRVDDDNMVASTSGDSNYAQLVTAAPPGYGSVTDVTSGYGKVPKAGGDSGYARAPAANPTGEYAAISPTAPQAGAAPDGYARLPTTAFGTQNFTPGTPDYGRVPNNAAGDPNAIGADAYGRVPASQYARLNPTAPGGTASPSLSQRVGAGYGRVPNEAPPAGVLTTRRSSPAMPGVATPPSAQAAPAGVPPGDAAYVTARRNLPVSAGSATSPSLARQPSSPATAARSLPNMAPKTAVASTAAAPAMSARSQANYASVSVANSGTVNAPHQFAMQALQLMQGHETLAGHERFLRAQLGILAKAKEKASTSTNVYRALVQLGHEMGAYVAQMRSMVTLDARMLADALMHNASFQQHYISIQMQMRELKALIEHGDGFQEAINSELGQRFWQNKIGKNNSIQWAPFFQVLQATLGMNLTKVESFVRFMFDCNKEGKITTQSFNMFIHWFDYEGMKPPTTVKDFLLILMARAETVFFFEGFHGFCSRDQAESVLTNRPPTSFMIRLSDSSAGVFILSYIDSKYSTRHRLLNQVDKQGFMVEQSTYNTLPDLLQARHEVLALPVPNVTSFDTSNDAIYGGGDAFYDSLASAAVPAIKSGEPYYHAKIVLNRMWVQVRLDLRDSELVIVTTKSPLRRSLALTEITECVVCQAPSGSLPCFRVVAGGQAYVFGCPDPQDWVQAVQGAVAADHRRGTAAAAAAGERTAEEKLANGIVTRRADLNEQLSDLQRAYFSARRRPGELSQSDLTFIRCLNAALAKQHTSSNKKSNTTKPPQLSFSKLDLDLQLNGQKCEVEVPLRDTVVVRNDGGVPVELRVDTVKKQSHTLKFVPNQMTLAAGQSEELHVTLHVHQTATVKELVHVSIGPNRGHSSIFLALDVSSKIMESLVFEEIDFGPRLGAGAFGQVFQGTYRGREVAVKAVGFEPDFDQELNILRELRPCPTIVEYIGSCKRVPFQGFIVLEFMQLGSLDKYIHDKSFGLTLQFSMRVAHDVANGLAHLHRSKIMHLDMKPANVLVSSLSLQSDACVKLADFGLSQSRDSAASFRGDFVEGTLLYMAPEMLREKLFCVPASDHQLLTNRGFLYLHDVLAVVDFERHATSLAPLVRHNELRVRDWRSLRIASFDMRTKRIVYEQPRALAFNEARSASAVPPLVQFSSADGATSVVVTPNHDMYVDVKGGGSLRKMSAKKLLATAGNVMRFQAGADGGAAGVDVNELRGRIARLSQQQQQQQWRNERCIETASVAARDELVQMLVAAGYAPRFVKRNDDGWSVLYTDAGLIEMRRDKDAVGALSVAELERYRGDVTWCCTMPSGFVIVRRVLEGGSAATRPTVQGNSQKGDIFSFGMTMWETLKREQPYSGEKHRKLKKPEFEEVRERGELPGELTEIEPLDVRELLSRMLSFDHEARPTADECGRQLQIIRSKLPPV